MLSVLPDSLEPAEPLNFEFEPGVLREYKGQFPENDPDFEIKMPPIEREEWLSVLLKIFGVLRGNLGFASFFNELVARGALQPESINNFVNASSGFSEKEEALFMQVFRAVRGDFGHAYGAIERVHSPAEKTAFEMTLGAFCENSNFFKEATNKNLEFITNIPQISEDDSFTEKKNRFNNLSQGALFRSPT